MALSLKVNKYLTAHIPNNLWKGNNIETLYQLKKEYYLLFYI